MQRHYVDREAYGPEFDDRLIKLVRANPAIYDVSHPHYRRNPVRVAIWERISNELGTCSRFLQTKWKNIRYNYLQEIKSIETGQPNANLRKRRFTEDLSFLQNTAQMYNVKKALMYKNSTYNSSDNESNSVVYAEPEPVKLDAYEIIEIEHSDDGSEAEYNTHNNNNNNNSNNNNSNINNNKSSNADNHIELDCADNEILPELMVTAKKPKEPKPDVTIEQKYVIQNANNSTGKTSPTNSYHSNNSSPLLTPLVVMGNGDEQDHQQIMQQQEQQPQSQHNNVVGNGKTTNGEVTIERIPKATTQKRNNTAAALDIMWNATKRKSMPAPLPALTPINDPIELYCLSLVDSLRNMPRTERERVKYEFANILKDAKYKDQL